MMEQNRNDNIEDLKAELQDVGREIDQLVEKDDDEFRDGAKQVLADFNQKIENFENNMEQTGEKIDQQTQESIKDLKDKSQEIENKLDRWGNNTQTNTAEFKAEIKHDFNQFGESVKDFFKDNV
jgi:ElaB/YqjD/DUF883 family membrane-anchored ribosome-binding protein